MIQSNVDWRNDTTFLDSGQLNLQSISIKFINSMSRIIFHYAFLQPYLAMKEKKGVRLSEGMSERDNLDLDEFDYDLSNTILLAVYYLPNFRMRKIIVFPCTFPIGDYDP